MMLESRSRIPARMAEQVDAADLKSAGYCNRAGSTPAPGTNCYDSIQPPGRDPTAGYFVFLSQMLPPVFFMHSGRCASSNDGWRLAR